MKICSKCIHFHYLYGACWHPENTDGDQTWNRGNECPKFERISARMERVHQMDRLPPGPPYKKIKRD